jgi:hypothetical protein
MDDFARFGRTDSVRGSLESTWESESDESSPLLIEGKVVAARVFVLVHLEVVCGKSEWFQQPIAQLLELTHHFAHLLLFRLL